MGVAKSQTITTVILPPSQQPPPTIELYSFQLLEAHRLALLETSLLPSRTLPLTEVRALPKAA